MNRKNEWVKIPKAWFFSLKYRSLKPKDLEFLQLVWVRTENGEVPKNPKEAQILAGVNSKPSRIAESLKTLNELGFLEDGGNVFFLAQWRQIFPKPSASYGKGGRKIRRVNQSNPQGYTDPSRARALSLSERENIESEKTPLGGCFDSEKETIDDRALEVLKKYEGKK